MRKILLTSSAFDNKRIGDIFLTLSGKKPDEIRVLFVPTAAIHPVAILMLSKRMESLLSIGIPVQNITVYDLHRKLTFDNLCNYDAILFSGGDDQYLLQRIYENQFHIPLTRFINRGGIYVGVSGGSIIATNKTPEHLGFVNCTLGVHHPEGTAPGVIDITKCPHIDITDNQALLLHDSEYKIVE